MTIHNFADQEFLSNPEAGIVGDCWRACIANALSLPIADVPHFVRDHDTDYVEATQQWLEQEGELPLVFCPPTFTCASPSSSAAPHATSSTQCSSTPRPARSFTTHTPPGPG
ncbi:hypothetical protein [Mycolicibacterium llatzerense]|nr:hypothetical protein [Mycolicibacterium llatzerense]